LQRIRTEAESEILAGVEFAKNAPYPHAAEVNENVYS
jgi:TPP-dependent pyruvate/acetoin dehydrogenase alpha subunit